jgi:hypothetical protein
MFGGWLPIRGATTRLWRRPSRQIASNSEPSSSDLVLITRRTRRFLYSRRAIPFQEEESRAKTISPNKRGRFSDIYFIWHHGRSGERTDQRSVAGCSCRKQGAGPATARRASAARRGKGDGLVYEQRRHLLHCRAENSTRAGIKSAKLGNGSLPACNLFMEISTIFPTCLRTME